MDLYGLEAERVRRTWQRVWARVATFNALDGHRGLYTCLDHFLGVKQSV